MITTPIRSTDNGSTDSLARRKSISFVQTDICNRIYIENNRRFESLENTNKELVMELRGVKESIDNFVLNYTVKEANNKALVIIGKITVIVAPIIVAIVSIAALYLFTKSVNITP